MKLRGIVWTSSDRCDKGNGGTVRRVQQGQEGDSGRGREVHDGCDSTGGMRGHLEAAQVARERCN